MDRFAPSGFGYWVELCSFVNLFLLTLLVRSGLEILSAHPKLYWNDGCTPGSECLRFTRRKMPEDQPWTSSEEAEKLSPWIALPGRGNIGMGRHWHAFCAILWMLNGALYIVALFVTGEWRKLLPASLAVFPQAWNDLLLSVHLRLAPGPGPLIPVGAPHAALVHLGYAAALFGLAPLTIASGVALSPAVIARFPGFIRVFGGRQGARSVHFCLLVGWLLFICARVAHVCASGFSGHAALLTHGGGDDQQRLAASIALASLALVILLNVIATRVSLVAPRFVQRALGLVVAPVQRILYLHVTSKRARPPGQPSAHFRVDGSPPESDEFREAVKGDFSAWCLEISGLVRSPLSLSLNDLRSMRHATQVTRHDCVEGWSAIARCKGPSMHDILDRIAPLPSARYLVFTSSQLAKNGKPFYEVIDLDMGYDGQTILALEMNGKALTVEHGALCRLRVETQPGFKMVKWLRSIEVVEDYRHLGEGMGGSTEDLEFFGNEAGI